MNYYNFQEKNILTFSRAIRNKIIFGKNGFCLRSEALEWADLSLRSCISYIINNFSVSLIRLCLTNRIIITLPIELKAHRPIFLKYCRSKISDEFFSLAHLTYKKVETHRTGKSFPQPSKRYQFRIKTSPRYREFDNQRTGEIFLRCLLLLISPWPVRHASLLVNGKDERGKGRTPGSLEIWLSLFHAVCGEKGVAPLSPTRSLPLVRGPNRLI